MFLRALSAPWAPSIWKWPIVWPGRVRKRQRVWERERERKRYLATYAMIMAHVDHIAKDTIPTPERKHREDQKSQNKQQSHHTITQWRPRENKHNKKKQTSQGLASYSGAEHLASIWVVFKGVFVSLMFLRRSLDYGVRALFFVLLLFTGYRLCCRPIQIVIVGVTDNPTVVLMETTTMLTSTIMTTISLGQLCWSGSFHSTTTAFPMTITND